MTTRLWVKVILVLAVLLFMVMMGMSNDQTVTFRLKPFGVKSSQRSAIMYFAFFGAGVITGAVLAAGPSRSARGK